MAYKRTTRRRPRRAATPWYNKKYSPGDVAAAAWEGVKQLKGIINSEKHFHIVGGSNSVSTTGAFVPLCSILQGDGQSNRTGNSVLAKGLVCRFNNIANGSATATLLRIMIVQDNQQIADTDPTQATLLESDVMSGLALGALGRYKILMDKSFCLDNVSKKQNVVTKYLNLNHHIRWNGTATSDIQKGGIYLFLLSDEATNTPTCTYNCRLSFYDN